MRMFSGCVAIEEYPLLSGMPMKVYHKSDWIIWMKLADVLLN